MYKKLKTVDFFSMWLFIFEIESFNFCICQKTTFAWSDLEQASSWWINSKFCVYKVSIWRCLNKLIFSWLHFLLYMTPLNFQQGLVQPPVQWTRNDQNASLCSVEYSKWPAKILLDLNGTIILKFRILLHCLGSKIRILKR